MQLGPRWHFALALVMGLTAIVAWSTDLRELDQMRPFLPGFALFFAYSTGWYACKAWGR